jgi:hypothetical protein
MASQDAGSFMLAGIEWMIGLHGEPLGSRMFALERDPTKWDPTWNPFSAVGSAAPAPTSSAVDDRLVRLLGDELQTGGSSQGRPALNVRRLNGELLCTVEDLPSWRTTAIAGRVKQQCDIPIAEQFFVLDSIPLGLTGDLSDFPDATEVTLLRRPQDQVEWLRSVMFDDSGPAAVLSKLTTDLREDFTINLAAIAGNAEAWRHVSRRLVQDENFVRAVQISVAEETLPAWLESDTDYQTTCKKLWCARLWEQGQVRSTEVKKLLSFLDFQEARALVHVPTFYST